MIRLGRSGAPIIQRVAQTCKALALVGSALYKAEPTIGGTREALRLTGRCWEAQQRAASAEETYGEHFANCINAQHLPDSSLIRRPVRCARRAAPAAEQRAS
jgi:hypothetical protein